MFISVRATDLTSGLTRQPTDMRNSPMPLPLPLPTFRAIVRLAVIGVLGATLAGHSIHAQVDTKVATAGTLAIATITDVDADAKGRVYIADARTNKVHILTPALQPLTAIGTTGNDAGQYRDLQAVRVIDSSTFVTVERYLKRLYVYRWRGAEPEIAQVIQLPFQAYDVCVPSKNRFLVVGFYRGNKLHEVDSTGRILASYAPTDTALNEIAAEFVSRGRVACSSRDGDIVLTSQAVPLVEVLRFDSLATPARREYLQPIRSVKVELTERGARFSTQPDGFHSPGRAIIMGNLRVIAARTNGRRDGVVADSVRWYGYDRTAKRWTKYTETIGTLFPLHGDSALGVRDQQGSIEIRVVSLRANGWSPITR